MREAEIKDMCIIAQQAGLILRDGYEEQHSVQSKGRIDDLVTEMDKRSENFIVERIHALYPEHTIITEETGIHSGDSEHVWYIDPCDGTMNYAHGLPMFAVSIGYAHNGELTKGVIFDPMRNECFYAEKDQGAWLNGKPIYVSQTKNLSEALFVTGFSIKLMEQRGTSNFQAFEHFMKTTAGVRRTGVAALEIAYVASGRYDGMWSLKLSAWDVAAGFVIAGEAGARITGLDGSDNPFKAPYYDFIMANHYLHPLLAKELDPFKLV